MVPFAKMNGAGNKILVVDMRARSDQVLAQAAIALGSDPKTHFDQLMAIHSPVLNGTDAKIEIFNVDGTKAQACGNGTRCVVHALASETGQKTFTLQTVAGILNAREHEDETITVDMGEPVFEWDKIPLAEEFFDTRKIELQIGPIEAPVLHSPSAMSMGNPHIIFWVEKDVNSYDLERFGPLLENHPMLPEKANISIAQVLSETEINLRTWERGAGLTLACGSAACAAAICGARTERTSRSVKVNPPSGIPLHIEWRDNNHVMMRGPVEWEFSGNLDPQTGAWAQDDIESPSK